MTIAIPTALTIAGSDSGGGAGVQADLKTFAAHGVYGSSAITAITAQNTLGVHAAQIIEPDLVRRQIEAVLGDIGAVSVKTGMLGAAATVRAVAATLRAYGVDRLVVDPVMVATSGQSLLDRSALGVLRDELLPLALIVTPNLPEASALLGREIIDEDQIEQAARDLHGLGSRYVLLKGGHLLGDPVDLLYDGRDLTVWRGQRIDTPHTHGTGCAYSAAITALLARGLPPETAVDQAHAYLAGAIRRARPIGAGRSPVHHLYRECEW